MKDQEIIQYLPSILFLLNKEGIILFANECARKFFGFSDDYYKGKNFFQIFFPKNEEIQEKKEGGFIHKTYTSFGEQKTIFWKIKKVENQDDIIATGMDVTDLYADYESLKQSKSQAENANRAKTEFIAHTSHELRTPLNAVIGYSEMLLDEVGEVKPEEIKQDLEKINAAAKHLLALINSVLDLTKIEAGKMELFNEQFDITELLLEVATTVETLVQKKRNSLEVDFSRDLGTMFADRTKLREILFNLLSNACKFTENGKISLKCWIAKGDVFFQISDSGIGMSKEELHKLFVAYSQVGEKKFGGGTGLGLMLCKRLCELMGGEITVESKPNVGSTFAVKLPLVIRTPARKKKSGNVILVIDDDISVHEIIDFAVKKVGLNIVSAMNGKDGLELAKKCNPVAIILDLIMPEMDGWEVLKHLKQDSLLRDIPVIISTVDDTDQRGKILFKVEDYLMKPVNINLLINVLKRYRMPTNDNSLMIIDDDAQTREIVSRMAEKEGWQAIQADNGLSALNALNAAKPNLILLDLLMPHMNGFEFIQEFQKRPESQSIPVIILTSKDLSAEEKEFLSGYAKKILQKGKTDVSDLEKVIHELL